MRAQHLVKLTRVRQAQRIYQLLPISVVCGDPGKFQYFALSALGDAADGGFHSARGFRLGNPMRQLLAWFGWRRAFETQIDVSDLSGEVDDCLFAILCSHKVSDEPVVIDPEIPNRDTCGQRALRISMSFSHFDSFKNGDRQRVRLIPGIIFAISMLRNVIFSTMIATFDKLGLFCTRDGEIVDPSKGGMIEWLQSQGSRD